MSTQPIDVDRLLAASAGVPPAGLLASVSAAPARASFWLGLLALLLFLPGFFSIPPIDRDEPRFAQASKQMIETGDFVAIRFQGEARNKKPVGIYWLQAAAIKAAEALQGGSAARQEIWIYRLPSLAGAIASVLLTYWAARALCPPPAAFLAALLYGATLLVGVEARLATTDAVVAATVAAAMGALARIILAEPREGGTPSASPCLPFVFWTAIAVGILVKGPITPMVPLLAGAALTAVVRWRGDRAGNWLAALRPAFGALWCLALVAPWFVLILIKTGGSFLADSVGKDMLGKMAAAQELHGAPPGAYLLAFFVTAWPLAPIAVLAAGFAWRRRRDPKVAFLLAWLVPSWILFEAVPTKLPHYVLPLYPAIAILTALAIERNELVRSRPLRLAAAALLALVPLAAIAGAVGFSVEQSAPLGWGFFAVAPFAGAFAVLAARALWSRIDLLGKLGGAAVLFAASALSFETMAGQTLLSGPLFEPFAISPRLAAGIAAAREAGSRCKRIKLATTSYREPSLVFLTATDLTMTDASGAAAFLNEGPCRAAFVEAADEAAFRSALPAQAPVALASRVKGINLNGGWRLDIGIYVRQGAGP